MVSNNQMKCITNDDGYVLVGALLILLLLVLIGISATTSTTLELQIAGNDRIRKETFYRADGGTQLAARLVEENLGAPGGFTALDANNVLQDPLTPNNTILISPPFTFSENDDATRNETSVSDGVRDIAYFPDGYNPLLPNAIPHTNIIMDGVTSTTAGSGLQMLSGYEGKGKGTAGGGGQILYTIYSQHMGRSQSESVVAVEWRHVIGLELEGRY
jgi:Tfp pilus assembly protein PilX